MKVSHISIELIKSFGEKIKLLESTRTNQYIFTYNIYVDVKRTVSRHGNSKVKNIFWWVNNVKTWTIVYIGINRRH